MFISILKPNTKNISVTLFTLIILFISMSLNGPKCKILYTILVTVGIYITASLINSNQQENYREMETCASCDTENNTENNLNNTEKESCGVNGGEKLSPILDPRFNLREAAKHMILLEDHLFHSSKRCKQCCIKHLMTIEAFLDEAVTLDKDGKYHELIISVYRDFVKINRKVYSQLRSGKMDDDKCCGLAQEIRKPCMIEGSKIDV